MDVNLDDYTIPIFRAGEGEQDVLICDDYDEEPNPATALIEAANFEVVEPAVRP